MSDADDEPTIPVVCSACGTRTRVPFDDVAAKVSRHNEQLHGGEAIAEVDPDVLEALTDQVAKDMDLY